jgi:hypothetical protein
VRRRRASEFCAVGLLVLAATLIANGRSSAAEPLQATRPSAKTAFPAADLAFFESRIRPLLIENCYECHSASAKKLKGGLRLDSREALLAGGDSGPAVVPGNLESSPLIEAVHYGSFEMPPTGKLADRQIELLEEWVRRGAPMPQTPLADANQPAASEPTKIDFDAGRKFWSFQPLSEGPPPQVVSNANAATPIDAFLSAERAKHGLVASPPADRRTLIRRASFDVLGLPPTPEEVVQFVNDDAPDAFPRLVDRLLASPHYGERWGRHWLDLARYSDATASWLSSLAQAWHYRDWVIDSLNDDLPYDEFVRRQLAADQIPGGEASEIAALGYLGLSPAYWKELKLDKEVIKGTVAEEWEERVDAIGRTFLGLTIACARCHDHKFDPISTADYYAFAGVIANTRLIDRPVIPRAEYAVVEEARSHVESLQSQIKELKAKKPDDADKQISDLQRQIAEIQNSTPNYATALAHAVDDAALLVEDDGPDATRLIYKPGDAVDLAIQIRGNPSNPGPIVPRHFLTVLSDGEPQPFSNGSGRLELADSIMTDAAPLAARVIVNRVWGQYFGRGLVDTPSDFGAQGSRPTHPELLDHLAARLIASGWSLKSLHREILLSAAYQQTSSSQTDAPPEGNAATTLDPENRWLGRMTRKRLDVEAWRDGILAAAGVLDLQVGGPAVEIASGDNVRRTVYGRIDRYELNDMLRLYDFPDPLGHSPRREPTTTPLQQLFVLNSPFLQQQAEHLAKRVQQDCPDDVAAQIERAYLLLFGRTPTSEELQLGREFLSSGVAEDPREAWTRYAQVLLGSNEFFFVD